MKQGSDVPALLGDDKMDILDQVTEKCKGQRIRDFTFQIGEYPEQESRIMKLKDAMALCNEPHYGESLIGQEI